MNDSKAWKKALPTLAGAVVIAVIVLVVMITRSSSSERAPAASAAGADPASPPRDRPTLAPDRAGPEHAHDHDHDEEHPVEEPLTMADDDKRRTGLVFSPDSDPEIRAAVEEQRKDWKPLTYDEMVAKSKPFLDTFALRERTLEQQIAAAESAGDEAKAKQRRIELVRLRGRKAELERALSENELP